MKKALAITAFTLLMVSAFGACSSIRWSRDEQRALVDEYGAPAVRQARKTLNKRYRNEERFELHHYDSIFIDRTVAVYDTFVRSKTGDSLPIGEAYRRFFAENYPMADETRDFTALTPDSAFVYDWAADFVGGRLSNYIVRPHYYSAEKEPRHVGVPPWPGGWSVYMDYGSRYLEKLGLHLARTNPVWIEWIDGVMAAGIIGPPSWISDDMDFGNKEERFLVALGFMSACLNRRDFMLVADVERSDSLKVVWAEYEKEMR